MNKYLFRKRDISLNILNFLNSKGFNVNLEPLDVSKQLPHIPLLLALFREGVLKQKLKWFLQKGLKLDTPITFFSDPKEFTSVLDNDLLNDSKISNLSNLLKEVITGPKTLAHWIILSDLLNPKSDNLISIFEKENPKIDLDWLSLLREKFSKEGFVLPSSLYSSYLTKLDWIESKLMNYSLPKPSCTTLKINSRL